MAKKPDRPTGKGLKSQLGRDGYVQANRPGSCLLLLLSAIIGLLISFTCYQSNGGVVWSAIAYIVSGLTVFMLFCAKIAVFEPRQVRECIEVEADIFALKECKSTRSAS